MSILRSFVQNKQLFTQSDSVFKNFIGLTANVLPCRMASKKAGGSTKNKKGHARPKHRGIHYQDGEHVQKGTMLVTQNNLRCHPGVNVGFGKNATLFAMEAGKVLVTCEKIDPNLDHNWIKKVYGGRSIESIYKKYFHVIPDEQHCRFKRIN